jgi:small subunit ribosomal protein S6
MINDVHKVHYLLFNLECSLEVLREIERNFKFNDSILRHLVIKRKEAVTEESPIAKAKAREDAAEAETAEKAAKADPGTDAEAEPDSQTELEADSGTDAVAESDSQTELEADAETDETVVSGVEETASEGEFDNPLEETQVEEEEVV